MDDKMCCNCGYFDPEDGKCYYFVDQDICFDGKPAQPMYTQPDDAACEVWVSKED